MVEKILIVQGGKLIDGTGRAPVENSIIVVQAGKGQSLARVTRSRDALMARDYVAPRK